MTKFKQLKLNNNFKIYGLGKLANVARISSDLDTAIMSIHPLDGDYKVGDTYNEEVDINDPRAYHLIFKKIESIDVVIEVLTGLKTDWQRRLQENESCQLPMKELTQTTQNDAPSALI
jgi:hypothetical protein